MDDHDPTHDSSAAHVPPPLSVNEGSEGGEGSAASIDRSRMPHRKRPQHTPAEADQGHEDDFSELVDEERFSRHRQKLAERDEHTTGGVIAPPTAQPEPEPPQRPKKAPQGKPGRTPVKPPKARKGDLIGVPKAIKKEYEDEDQPPDYG